MRLKINLTVILLYAVYALISVALNVVLPMLPLSLGLCFAMLICGANPIISPLIYTLASVVSLNYVTILLSLFEGGFLALITFIYRRTVRKIKAEAAAYLVIALAPFIVFSRLTTIGDLTLNISPYAVRAVLAAFVIIFACFSFRSVYALFFRIFRSKLKIEELICLAVFFTATGTGIFNLVGSFAYICLVGAVCAFGVRLFKSPTAIIFAVVAALPLCIADLDADAMTAATAITILSLTCCSLGQWAAPLTAAGGTCAWLYITGLYSADTLTAVMYTLLLLFMCLCCALIGEERLTKLHSLLTLDKVLPKAENERMKEYLCEKLYRMSEVFREVENAFVTLEDGPDDGAMKRRMLHETKETMCARCPRAELCKSARVYKGFAALIETGCLKGKVSFVDLTSDVTKNCINPSALTETVNKLLYEYRKSTLEAENAKNGRKLLAEQAKGVAEVLKGKAAELCRSGGDYSRLKRLAARALAESGISCPEMEIYGGECFEINLTVVDCKDFSPVKECLEKICETRLIVKNKYISDEHRCVYQLVKPPLYDAAFGVAFRIKDGEMASGDTHSVIRISERRFLMALSDGMGSGEYARKVSETAMALIEAFCRAEMPCDIMLDTINKLLCFNRDERFTCIDAAAIDLDTLSAGFVKIGSPIGLIVRKGEIKVLESISLPMGILDNLHPATSTEQLQKNDIVVFMSDGITSAFSSSADLYEYVGGLKALNPQALADNILAGAEQRSCGIPDDMTVLCVRLYEKSA